MSSSIQSGDIEGQRLTNEETEGATWWCKLLVKLVAFIAAVACGISSIFVIIFNILSPICIFAGVLMMIITILLLLMELPWCCKFSDHATKFSAYTDKFKYWQRGLLYVLISLVPCLICFSWITFSGCLCPFATGVIYGLMSLGKKADRTQMLANAAGDTPQQYSKFENDG